MKKLHENLQSILDNAIDNKIIFGTSFCIKHKEKSWCGTSGNFNIGDQYFIASTSKLFTTAVVMKLRSEGRFELEDKISKYLDSNIIKGLHVLNGEDYSSHLTIKNLLAHTSGLSDYFLQKDENGNSIVADITVGKDRFIPFEEIIDYTKSLTPLFAPDTKGKAYYSDTNYQLLGKIIENVTGKSINDNYNQWVIQPLELIKTYLFCDIVDKRPKPLYYLSDELHIPKAMASFGPDGGLVSTSEEVMIFIEAFYQGKLFPVKYIEEMKVWNKIYFPMQSGIGIHRFRLPWFMDPFRKIPDLIGHSGLSGALGFYSPEKNLFVAGTVNQTAYNDLSFKLVIKLIKQTMKK